MSVFFTCGKIDAYFINGKQSYGYVINQLSSLLFIPVIGIDRSDERNSIVFEDRKLFLSDTIALRAETEDILNGYKDLQQLATEAMHYFAKVELIIDNKIINAKILNHHFSIIKNFIMKTQSTFSKIIVTGSIMPKSISDLLPVKTTMDFTRHEISLYEQLNQLFPNLYYGDYTIISPYYSDADFAPGIFPNVTTAKIIYAYKNLQHIQRGSVLAEKTTSQYNDLCRTLTKEPFYRGKNYSFGDNTIFLLAMNKKNANQSSILAPTINAHITYMYRDFQL